MWRRRAWRKWSIAHGQHARRRTILLRHVRRERCGWPWLLSLKTVSLFNETISQIVHNFEGFVFGEAMLSNQLGQERAVDAASNIVPGRDGKERAGVVVEAHSVIEACRLCGLFAKAHHAFRTIVKPPGRSEAQAGIVTGQWR